MKWMRTIRPGRPTKNAANLGLSSCVQPRHARPQNGDRRPRQLSRTQPRQDPSREVVDHLPLPQIPRDFRLWVDDARSVHRCSGCSATRLTQVGVPFDRGPRIGEANQYPSRDEIEC
jgi:hypothetical protein